MVMTAAETNLVAPPDECWCCGDRTAGATRLRLHAHPDVGVCVRCVRWLDQQRVMVDRRTGQAPTGSLWQQIQDRAAGAFDGLRKGRSGIS
jgi:hypothetical protein